MSVQDESWFQELVLAAAHNNNPEVKTAKMSFALSPSQVVSLVEEFDRLIEFEGEHVECKCGHPYKNHQYDGVIRMQFCRDCTGLRDLHDFELAK